MAEDGRHSQDIQKKIKTAKRQKNPRRFGSDFLIILTVLKDLFKKHIIHEGLEVYSFWKINGACESILNKECHHNSVICMLLTYILYLDH